MEDQKTEWKASEVGCSEWCTSTARSGGSRPRKGVAEVDSFIYLGVSSEKD